MPAWNDDEAIGDRRGTELTPEEKAAAERAAEAARDTKQQDQQDK